MRNSRLESLHSANRGTFTQLRRIRFAESESGFGSDSVKLSIQCANPNPDSRIQRIQFWRGFTCETGSKWRHSGITDVNKQQWRHTAYRGRGPWTTPTNPVHSICLWIRIWTHYESESRFGQIEYGLCRCPVSKFIDVLFMRHEGWGHNKRKSRDREMAYTAGGRENNGHDRLNKCKHIRPYPIWPNLDSDS